MANADYEESAGILRGYPATCIRLQVPCLVPTLKKRHNLF